MSTTSQIGYEHDNGAVHSIYCHWDGYPEHVGEKLCEHYGNSFAVLALLALGDISSLRARVAPNEGETHSYKDPRPDVTIAYHRDRGQQFNPARWHNNIDDLATCGQDYAYCFRKDRNWYVYVDDEWRLVRDVLAGGEADETEDDDA